MGLVRYLSEKVKERFPGTPKWIKKFKWRETETDELQGLTAILTTNGTGIRMFKVPLPPLDTEGLVGFVLGSAIDYAKLHDLKYVSLRIYDDKGNVYQEIKPRHRLGSTLAEAKRLLDKINSY